MDVDFFGLFLWPPFCLVCRCARYATRACDVRDLPQALFECVMSTLPRLLGFTGFYWVLLFFFVSTKVPLGSPVFYWVCLVLVIQSQLSFIGCYRAELALPRLLGFTGFYWVLLFFCFYQGPTWFTGLLLGLFGFVYPVTIKFYWLLPS